MRLLESYILETINLIDDQKVVSVNRILKMVENLENISIEEGIDVKILYSLNGEDGRVEYRVDGEKVSGAIDFNRVFKGRRELGDFFIFETFPITGGYGPLLYEILVEKATEKGVCLMSDPEGDEVSDRARSVWDKYLKRAGGVIDIEYKQIEGGDISSSLSKCYRKVGPLVILEKLRGSEYIDFIEEEF